MAKVSQARKAHGDKKPGPADYARGDAAKAPGESERPAVDSGVDVASIDAAFAQPAPVDAERPARPAKKATQAAKAADRK